MTDAAILAAELASVVALLLANSAYLTWRFNKKDRALREGVGALNSTVEFLQSLNELPLGLSIADLQTHLWNRLKDVLRPLNIDCRLWLVDSGWKTLRGYGELSQAQSSSLHLPMAACPALVQRRAFHFRSGHQPACASEQFHYGKHICLPLMDGRESFGVLFLASRSQHPWSAQELNLFKAMTQALALSLERRAMFDKLQEKISELHFSFEVGASALTAFDGSTQSLEDTTQHVLDAVLSVLKVDRVSFMEWDSTVGALSTKWVRGESGPLRSPLRLGRGEGIAGWSLQLGEPYWSEYAMGDPHFMHAGNRIVSLLCVPVFSMTHEPLGVINALTLHSPRRFTVREIQFLNNFSRLAGLAIENAKLHTSSRANIHHLNEVNQLKSQFLSLVSHDLRGPLTGIRGFAEVLKEQTLGTLSPVQIDLLDQLERQVELQERMVDDLLDFARMEKGKLSVYPTLTNLETVLREECEKSKHAAKEREITLTREHRGPLPLSEVTVDPGRIRQVVWNLIHNAIKFTPEGGKICVRTECSAKDVTVHIEDNGAGLPPEAQDRIFDKFFQITPGGSKGSQGLGLGLAICKEIITAHNGHIHAQSAGPGLGTTMTFVLPRHPPKDHIQIAA